MNNLLQNFISARDALYDHCGFKEDWIAYPIEAEDIDKYWRIENEVWKQDGTKEESESTFDGTLRMADTIEDLKDENDEGNYYEASLVRHRFFHGKSIYRGKNLTLIIGCPHVDGMIWLYVLDNAKEIKEIWVGIYNCGIDEQRRIAGFAEGDKVRFEGVDCKEQIQWGGHVDPESVNLKIGDIYIINKIEIHDSWTGVYLEGYEGHFNNLWFSKP